MKKPEPPPGVPSSYNYGEVLQKLSEKNKFQEFVDISQNKYLYWDKWKYLAKDWNIDPKLLWAAVKSSRLHAVRLYFNTLPNLSISSNAIVQELLHTCDMNLGGYIQGESIVPSEEKDRYLMSSLMEEAIASSQLEGADTSRKFAKEMLANNIKPKNISEQMIVNNYEAMQWIAKNKQLPITPENICALHAIITKNTLTRQTEEGVFRSDNDVVVRSTQTGEILHQPPPFEELEKIMNEYCAYCNDEKKESYFIHPVSKGIIAHFLLGYIHPFADGNGRTARVIFYWYLLKKGYWLIEYMSVSRIILQSKAKYARAYLYTELDALDVTYFIMYNLECILRALEELKIHIKRKTAEKRNLLNLLKNSHWNNRQISILQEILKDPLQSYTVQAIQTWFGVSNQTARTDLNELVKDGLLLERSRGRKYLYFPVSDAHEKIQKWIS